MIKFFNQRWDTVPIVVIDTETTGLRLGRDKAVSVGLVRFENGEVVGRFSSLVRPGIPIPATATAIHKITDSMVDGAPTIDDVFADSRVVALLDGAQPSAYNASYDRYFVVPFGENWDWPWLDGLSLVRKVDKWAKGAGRHKLEATCARHGIPLTAAHDAEADALAAGQLLIKLAKSEFPPGYTLGQALDWQRRAEAASWFDFNSWLSRQPPREEKAAS